MANKKIVIVGTDFAAVYAAKKLARHFKKHSGVDLFLISQSAYLSSRSAIRGVAVDRLLASQSEYDLQTIFHAKKNLHLLTSRLLSIDPENKKIVTDSGSLSYDCLILSTDQAMTADPVPGVKQAAFRLHSLDQALGLRNKIAANIRLGALEKDREKRRQLLTISVIGASFNGLQTLADLIDWRQRLAAENKIDAAQIKLCLIDKKQDPLAQFSDKLQPKILRYLNHNQVQLTTAAEVVSVGSGYIDLFDGKKLFSSTIIWAAGDPKNALTALLPEQENYTTEVYADAFGQLRGRASIYLVGSRMQIKDSAEKQPLPDKLDAKMTVNAVCKNVAAAMADKSKKKQLSSKAAQETLSFNSRLVIAKNAQSKQRSGIRARWLEKKSAIMFFFHIGSMYYLWRQLTKKSVNRNRINRHQKLLWTLTARLFLAFIWLTAGLGLLAQGYPALSDHVPTFVQNGFLLRSNLASAIQTPILLLILIIAAALLLGVFTWFASLLSLCLVIFLIASHSFVWSYIWMLPMTLAIMNGSGRAAGIDKYLLPWLAKNYVHMRYGRPRALYQDDRIK